MVKLIDYNLKDYAAILGDKVPAPGGGSATAIVLSYASSLYKKCLLYSSSAFKEEELSSILISLDKNIEESLSLVDKDRDAYLCLNKLIKDRETNADRLKEAYLSAASVPLEMIKLIIDTLNLIDSSLVDIKKVFLSDLFAAISFLEAAFDSALIFVEINLKSTSKSFEDFSGFKREYVCKIRDDFKRTKKDLRDE